ncbi:hypothetical protein K488DRAFT_92621 [Vararia minispora EC-137]|uniref:Uncharacterized protein n=1 Tax=Vararia minispora EC-137 TaxID=1314806 RepID=A0ACB8Q3V4_9AGAM|nr:hypothetical protein K488DRAFT_92621 [Vararia minispora EC-137]
MEDEDEDEDEESELVKFNPRPAQTRFAPPSIRPSVCRLGRQRARLYADAPAHPCTRPHALWPAHAPHEHAPDPPRPSVRPSHPLAHPPTRPHAHTPTHPHAHMHALRPTPRADAPPTPHRSSVCPSVRPSVRRLARLYAGASAHTPTRTLARCAPDPPRPSVRPTHLAPESASPHLCARSYAGSPVHTPMHVHSGHPAARPRTAWPRLHLARPSPAPRKCVPALSVRPGHLRARSYAGAPARTPMRTRASQPCRPPTHRWPTLTRVVHMPCPYRPRTCVWRAHLRTCTRAPVPTV